MTGDFDLDFANMTNEHHQGASDMSEQEVKMGKQENIKQIWQHIIICQKKEQATLKGILYNYKPMEIDKGKHDDLMQSMNEMKTDIPSLKMSCKSDIDFSLMMIAHHESAIKMAKVEIAHGMNVQLKSICTAMLCENLIKIMKLW